MGSSKPFFKGSLPCHLDETKPPQELSPSAGVGTGLRSPDRRTPPAGCSRGRTMKDFEDELVELRRENFDLKMRIYIMEEQKELAQGVENTDDIFKSTIELKTELSSLKKDLADKEDLILQAAKAMELLAAKHKEEIADMESKAATDRDNYRKTILHLEEELKMKVSEGSRAPFDDSSAMYAMAFSLPVKKSPSRQNIADDQVTTLELMVAKLQKDLKEALLDRDNAEESVRTLQTNFKDLQNEHKCLQESLASYMLRLHETQADVTIKTTEIQDLKDKLNRVELRLKDQESDSVSNKEKNPTVETQRRILEQYRLQISKLESEVDQQKKETEKAQLQNQIITESELRTKFEALKKENSNLHNQVQDLRTAQEKLISRQSPRLHRSLNMEMELERAQEENKRLETELVSIKKERQKALFALQEVVKENKALRKDLSSLKPKTGTSTNSSSSPSTRPSTSSDEALKTTDESPTEEYRVMVQELTEKLEQVTKDRDALSLELEKQVQVLLLSLKEKETQLKCYEEKTNLFCDSFEKDNRIAELECEVTELKALVEVQTDATEISSEKLLEELESKKKEVEHLNEELRKRTFNLQELVNKELWDKNREIEKLNKTCESKQSEINRLKQELTNKDVHVCKLVERVSELTKQVFKDLPLIDLSSNQNINFEETPQSNTAILRENKMLREQAFNEVEKNKKLFAEIETLKEKIKIDGALIVSLQDECSKFKKDIELCDKSRKELINACTLLTTRLEELASFLDSLLPSLGEKKRRMLQEAIERSREASRSFSFSFIDQSNLSVPILPDFSQVDFCSGEDSGDATLEPLKDSDNLQNDEVVRLRTQVESLVEKLKQKDNTSDNLAKQSPKRYSVWTLPPSDSQNDKCFDLASISDGIALEDVTEGSVLDTLESDNSKDVSDSIKSRSRRSSAASNLKLKSMMGGCGCGKSIEELRCAGETGGGCVSESEGMSEPDRSVSMARIGIKVGLLPPRMSADDSSSSARRCVSAPSSVKKMRHETSELRKLNNKLRGLEQVNEALRTELRALCRGSSNSKIDKAITCQMDPGNSTNVLTQLSDVSAQLEQSCKLCLELETKCMTLEGECTALKEKLVGEESKNCNLIQEMNNLNQKLNEADTVTQELVSLRAILKEKENEALEKQCSILELKNAHLILENRAKIAEAALEETHNKCKLLQSSAQTCEESLNQTRNSWKETQAQLEALRKSSSKTEKEKQMMKEKFDQDTAKLRLRLNQMKVEMDKLMADHREALAQANRKIDELVLLKEMAIDEWKVKLEALEKEKKCEIEEEMSRRMDAERKLVMSYEMQTELRSKLEVEMERAREMEVGRKLEERMWRRRLTEAETHLRRKLDAVTLTTSEAVLERTRLANDKLRLQQQLRHNQDTANQVKNELEERVAELEAANTELVSRLESFKVDSEVRGEQQCQPHAVSDSELNSHSDSGTSFLTRQRSNPSSDYMSDQEHHMNSNTNFWFPLCGRSNNNSSPDLGIESDQGRLSSLEPLPASNSNGDVTKLEAENKELRHELAKMRRALEETLCQLTNANQKKRQVEKAICKQLQKTHHILQKARVNLQSDQQS